MYFSHAHTHIYMYITHTGTNLQVGNILIMGNNGKIDKYMKKYVCIYYIHITRNTLLYFSCILSRVYGRNHFWHQNVTCPGFRD
jgi:hypothetical protein